MVLEPDQTFVKIVDIPAGVCIVKQTPCRTELNFTAPIAGQATLRLFDLSGRSLRTVYTGPITKGDCTIPFDADADRLRKARIVIARLSIDGLPNTSLYMRLAAF
jgi:hypothetical protein